MNRDGMILLRKPEGVTSFRALGILKKKLETKKVGHTGTLDKFATGLLVILTGKMTKFAPFITGMDKTYRATFTFGKTTSTLDPEGDVIETAEIPDLELIKKKIEANFTGNIEQTPPDFSAVHINGKRAYQLKLEGKEVKIPPRNIYIDKFDILNWDGVNLDVEISCSKGTYIRSIARDLGLAVNSVAYVTKLERTKVGPFNLIDSVSGEDFSTTDLVSPYNLISTLNKQISYVKEMSAKEIRNGKFFKKSYYTDNSEIFNDGEVALFLEENKELVAMLNITDNKYLFVSRN